MNLRNRYYLLGIVLLAMLRIFFWYLGRMKRQQADIRSRRTSVFFEADDDEEDELEDSDGEDD